MTEVALGANPSFGAALKVARLPSAAAGLDATLVQAGVSRLYRITFSNTSLAWRYVKLYNKASVPTVGTDTPLITIACAPQASISQDLTVYGVPFSLGIGYGISNGAADSDATTLAAGDIVALNLYYL